jgi:hypothetical protein
VFETFGFETFKFETFDAGRAHPAMAPARRHVSRVAISRMPGFFRIRSLLRTVLMIRTTDYKREGEAIG